MNNLDVYFIMHEIDLLGACILNTLEYNWMHIQCWMLCMFVFVYFG